MDGTVGLGSLQSAQDDALPIFDVQRVDMQFSLSAEFVAAQVANNTLVLALQTGRIMRIDLESPSDIDDIDLPKKPSEIGTIRRIFLDPTASHLIVSTNLGQNYYLHTQSRTPKPLSRLRDVLIECVSWNPSQPTASTREILVGSTDGNIYETFLELSTEMFRRDEKYVKNVYKTEAPVCNIWTDVTGSRSDIRRILVATAGRLLHFTGRNGKQSSEGSGSAYSRIFESESPVIHEPDPGQRRPTTSGFAVTPEPPDTPTFDASRPERIFAWLSAQKVLHGKLLTSPTTPDLGRRLYDDATVSSNFALSSASDGIKIDKNHGDFIALTQWHILQVFGNKIIATNRLDNSVIYNQAILATTERPIALLADYKKNTFWFFTNKAIFEIVVRDEDRDIWKVLMKRQKFEEALQYANNAVQKDAVATASGDYLIKSGKYAEAAAVYGKSTKPFEEVSLQFLDKGQRDALRKYLITKLSTLKKSSIMQRIMVSSWLIELFMSKLNSLDDMVSTGAELAGDNTPTDVQDQLRNVKQEFYDYVRKHKNDLDPKTAYEIISSHGREDELLFFATTVNDYNYVLSYWVQRGAWAEALQALNRQPSPDIIYQYSSALMTHASFSFVEILMRQSNLDPRKLIPACLAYNETASSYSVPLKENQAVRYLLFEINQHECRDSAVHNTLISIYASSPSTDESALLAYLEHQTPPSYSRDETQPYDGDFALRLCMQHTRICSAVHIYGTMLQYDPAVNLALQYNQTDLAVSVAERPEHEPATRKKLWLAIARSVIAGETPATLENVPHANKNSDEPKGLERRDYKQQEPASIKTALALLRRAPPGVLRIEDLLPLFPDFVLIDDFKEEICEALESYARQIDELRQEMDDSAATASRIKREVADLDKRWVLLEPGEGCGVCGEVLLDRRFWVWGCGHGVHGDCVVREVGRKAPKSVSRRVREIRSVLEGSGVEGQRREILVKELDDILGRECPLCGEMAVRMVDEGFGVTKEEEQAWAL